MGSLREELNKDYQLAEISILKRHEKADPKRLNFLLEQIKRDGFLKKPITVDKKTFVIIDGEHRLEVLKALNCRKIPVIFIDYMSDHIRLFSRREEFDSLTKEKVIDAAYSNQPFPPKTTKHMIDSKEGLKHISSIEKSVNIPLEALMR